MDNINITITSTPSPIVVNDSPVGNLVLAITSHTGASITIASGDIYSLIFTEGSGTFNLSSTSSNEITYDTMVFDKVGTSSLEFKFERPSTYEGSKNITFVVANNPSDLALPVTKIAIADVNVEFRVGTPYKILNKSTGNVTLEEWSVVVNDVPLDQSELTIVENTSMTFTPKKDGKYTITLKNTNGNITGVKKSTSDIIVIETARAKVLEIEMIVIIVFTCIVALMLISLAIGIIVYMSTRKH